MNVSDSGCLFMNFGSMKITIYEYYISPSLTTLNKLKLLELPFVLKM